MTFWIARCEQCGMDVPFWSEGERDAWAEEHSGARGLSLGEQHTVVRWTEHR